MMNYSRTNTSLLTQKAERTATKMMMLIDETVTNSAYNLYQKMIEL